MFSVGLLTAFLLSTSHAEVKAIPSLDSLPLLWAMTNNDPKYRDAALNAQKALFMQTGLTSQYNLFSSFLTDKVAIVASKLENEAACVIRDTTAINPRYVFFVMALGYSAAVKREVRQEFTNPLFKNVKHVLSLTPSVQTVSVQIPF